jgi:hypothetical protein
LRTGAFSRRFLGSWRSATATALTATAAPRRRIKLLDLEFDKVLVEIGVGGHFVLKAFVFRSEFVFVICLAFRSNRRFAGDKHIVEIGMRRRLGMGNILQQTSAERITTGAR